MKMIHRLILLLIMSLICYACSHTAPPESSRNTLKVGELIHSVYFDMNSADIKDLSALEHNSRWIKSHPQKVVLLEGHCDERGDREFNLHLGDKRARSVMKALMDFGVSENQIIIVSHGKDRPTIRTQSESGWAKNRRVDFVLR